MKFPTLDELILYGEQYGIDVNQILKHCEERRKEHRYAWNGFTENRSGRFEGEIPRFCVDLHPETKKMFDVEMDKQERNKGCEQFFRMYPQFLVVDRYGKNISIK